MACTNSQVPDLDAIVVPVSGGGMISGIALCCSQLAQQTQQQQQSSQQDQQAEPTLAHIQCKPGLKVVAAEPVGRQVSVCEL